MSYRLTVVLQYPDKDSAPRIGCNTKDFGNGRVVAVQFNDALAELQSLHENASPADAQRAMQAADSAADDELPEGWPPFVTP